MSAIETLANVTPPPNWYVVSHEYEEERLIRAMAELNRRTSAVASIRRISTEILVEAYTGDVYALQQQQTSLQAHFARFSAAHDILIGVADTDAVITEHNRLWIDIETLYNEAMAKLHRLSAPLLHPLPRADADDFGSVHSQQQVRPLVEGKLEPLAVAKFDGALHHWLAFKDSFETLVHNQEFSEAYKLGRLREAVGGEAARLVGGTYSGGYQEVWRALTERYDRPRHLAGIHISAFLGMPQAQHETKSSLLSIVDTVGAAFRALTVMELPVDQWDALAVEIIQTKLPTNTQQAWGMSLTSKEVPKLQELLSFVEKRAHILPVSAPRPPGANQQPNSNAKRRTGSTTSPQQPSRLVKTNLAAAVPGHCAYCNTAGHAVARCSQLISLPVADRFTKLKGSNLCFNCLTAGHGSKSCTGGNCRRCNGRHHTILCRQVDAQSVSNDGVPPATQPPTASSAVTATPPINWTQRPH